jgi:hypothetical protein
MAGASRRISTLVCVAALAAIFAIPALTHADPRPNIPHPVACHGTPIEYPKIRVTHFAANSLLAKDGHSACDRARHMVNDFATKESCSGFHMTVCNLGPYGPHGIYYELSCRHYYDPDLHHWHHCSNQSTGARLNIDWHRKH